MIKNIISFALMVIKVGLLKDLRLLEEKLINSYTYGFKKKGVKG